MSLSEDSDDEAFESADEDIEDVQQYGHQLDIIDNKVNDNTNDSDNRIETNELPQSCEVNKALISENKMQLKEEIDVPLIESKVVNEMPIIKESILCETSVQELKPNVSTSSETVKTDDQLLARDLDQRLSLPKEGSEQPIIKGRKLLRKSDRIKTSEEQTCVSEDKKSEVLNKLANISAPKTSGWNNWFNDIKSAAASATSTTVSHASNWSLNPKTLLSSAATITSQVVENVGSVMDSAIGAPKPEEMAAIVRADQQMVGKDDDKPQCVDNESNSSKLNLNFMDYTLNTLELIGKKTMEVIVDDKNKVKVEDNCKQDKQD